MADATNEVRLWRNRGGWWVGDPGHYRIDRETWLREMGTEYIARPRADDEARTERIEKLRDEGFAMHAAYNEATRDRDEWKARAERAEAECAAREDVQARLIKERNAAEAERDSARALLREARPHVQHSIDEGAETGIELLARLDAETGGMS